VLVTFVQLAVTNLLSGYYAAILFIGRRLNVPVFTIVHKVLSNNLVNMIVSMVVLLMWPLTALVMELFHILFERC